jgi:hypothetical protein
MAQIENKKFELNEQTKQLERHQDDSEIFKALYKKGIIDEDGNLIDNQNP